MSRKAQSTLEDALSTAVVIGALIAVQVYVKRGMEGRLRSSADDIGTQYDITTGGYNQKIELQGSKVDISVSGNSDLLTVTGPGIGVIKRYTDGTYDMKSGTITTTEGAADLGW